MTMRDRASLEAWRAFETLTDLTCWAPNPEAKFEKIFDAMALKLSFPTIKKVKGEETDNDSDENPEDRLENVIKTIEQKINTKFSAIKRTENKGKDMERSGGLEEPLHKADPSTLRKTETEVSEPNVMQGPVHTLHTECQQKSAVAEMLDMDVRDIEDLNGVLQALNLDEEEKKNGHQFPDIFTSESEEEGEVFTATNHCSLHCPPQCCDPDGHCPPHCHCGGGETSWSQEQAPKNPEQLLSLIHI